VKRFEARSVRIFKLSTSLLVLPVTRFALVARALAYQRPNHCLNRIFVKAALVQQSRYTAKRLY
jgi:hypothetical protein